jgi:hypothetical protein
MKLLFAIIVLVVATASPAAAQLHERGVARTGAVQKTTTGNTAFLCRIACSVEAGCTGWSWTRAGSDEPQARCELLTGPLQSRADNCCDSGLNGEVLTPAAPLAAPLPASVVSRGDQYATRSQQPLGPPVQLTGDVTGGIWTDQTAAEDEEETDTAEAEAEDEAEGENEETLSAEEEDDARFDAAQQADAPVTTTPSARITSVPLRGGDTPAYSVQREYGATAPAAPSANGLRSARLP